MNDIPDSSRGVATRANANQRRVFRVPLAPRLLSLFGVIFLAGITAIMIGFAAIAFTMHWALGLFMLACAGFIGALTGYVGRDLRGKWGLRVVLDGDAVTLDLPAGRSLIHRPPAQHLTIPYTDIEAIDARFEAYGTLGMEMMQRLRLAPQGRRTDLPVRGARDGDSSAKLAIHGHRGRAGKAGGSDTARARHGRGQRRSPRRMGSSRPRLGRAVAATRACDATVAACGLDWLARDLHHHSCNVDNVVLPHRMMLFSGLPHTMSSSEPGDGNMRRREFLGALGGAATAWPLAARGQQPARQQRIAIFHPAIPTTLLTETGGGSAWPAFFGELRRLGYVEGENLIIERYSAEGHHERYADLAREIVTRNPDVIVTGTNPVVIAFKAATSTIPVVAFMLDPLKAGLVTSLARPGGNLTGITLDAGIEIWGKRLQMLKEAIPSTTTAAFLGMRDGWEGSSGEVLRAAGAELGISLVFMLPQKGNSSEIERVFAVMEQQRPDAVLVSGEGDLYAHRQLIAELAEKNRLPVMCPYRDYVEAGGLMAYAVDLAELLRRMADDVHQILKGAKPGDIPIYQPTKFELLINLKTARALGLTLPPALLALAAETIQ
jgi:putative ABC transport system substrate-binding protein